MASRVNVRGVVGGLRGGWFGGGNDGIARFSGTAKTGPPARRIWRRRRFRHGAGLSILVAIHSPIRAPKTAKSLKSAGEAPRRLGDLPLLLTDEEQFATRFADSDLECNPVWSG